MGSGLKPFFAPDGTRLFTTRRSPAPAAELWDIDSGRLVTSFRGHSNEIRVAAFSPDGRRVLTADWERVAKVWDAATGREWKSLVGHLDRIECAAFSPDGSRVLTGSADKSARLWDLEASPGTLLLTNALRSLSRAAFCANGRLVVAHDWRFIPGALAVWDTQTGEQFVALEYSNLVNAAISPDGARLVTIDREMVGSRVAPPAGPYLAIAQPATGALGDGRSQRDDYARGGEDSQL